MSRYLHFNSVGGASGDMVLGCLFDLGVEVEGVRAQLDTLDLGDYRLQVERVSEGGFRGTRVTVETEEAHRHRTLVDIRQILEGSALDPGVARRALAVFERLAEAEAAVHGVAADEVHFHEVGARDALIDIVGSCAALQTLGIAAVSMSAMPLGQGTTTCAHGTIPVPAPATVELLKGFAVTPTDEPHELVTPTGAALLSTWCGCDGPPVGQSIAEIGHGFGHRKLEHRPNLLRGILLEAPPARKHHDTCLLLECNLDDTTPELVGSLGEQLFAAGALDVFVSAIQMKKNRPGTLLGVLCPADLREAMLNLIFRGTTTFGVREQSVDRTVLERDFEERQTPYGVVRVKRGRWHGEVVTESPEMDDCIRRAEEHGVTARQVYEAAMKTRAEE